MLLCQYANQVLWQKWQLDVSQAAFRCQCLTSAQHQAVAGSHWLAARLIMTSSQDLQPMADILSCPSVMQHQTSLCCCCHTLCGSQHLLLTLPIPIPTVSFSDAAIKIWTMAQICGHSQPRFKLLGGTMRFCSTLACALLVLPVVLSDLTMGGCTDLVT